MTPVKIENNSPKVMKIYVIHQSAWGGPHPPVGQSWPGWAFAGVLQPGANTVYEASDEGVWAVASVDDHGKIYGPFIQSHFNHHIS